MRLITRRDETLEVLARCRAHGVALFAPNGELPAEIEGLCMAGQRFAEQHNILDLPIAVGMTGVYADNPQLRKLSLSCKTAEDASGFEGGDVREGCEIWLRHLACYEDLLDTLPRVVLLPFLDHGWATGEPNDRAVLFDESVVDRMAMIMFDASKLDCEENIRLTAEYVRCYGDRVVIEAAGDRIYSPQEVRALALSREDQLSKPDEVERFVRQTGVDLIVPNLGTEHRSVAVGKAERRYERDLARALRERVGAIMALHGSSSLGGAIGTTAEDGICKVNFYTAMAVGAGNKIYDLLRRHEDKVLQKRDLWINSASWFHDVRRRHVAEVCDRMLSMLAYERLGS